MGTEVLIITSLLSLATQQVQQNKIEKQQDDAYEAQKESAALRAERERQSLIAQEQQQQAQLQAAASASGAEGSSSSLQAEQSLGTQLSTELTYIDQQQELADRQATAQTNINKIQGDTDLANSIFGAASKLYG